MAKVASGNGSLLKKTFLKGKTALFKNAKPFLCFPYNTY